MKSTKLFLFIALFLVSCTTPATTEPILTATSTPAPTATPTLVPSPTITPAPTQVGGGSGKIVFTYRKDEFLTTFPELKGETNVFIADIDGNNLTPVTNGLEGRNNFMDVSPDGNKLLITSTSNLQSKEANLYLAQIDSLDVEPTKLAEDLPNYYGGNSSAKWINDSEIVYVGQGEAGFGIYTINSDGTNSKNIYTNTSGDKLSNPFEILKVTDSRIYWDAQVTTRLTSNSVNNKYYISWTSLDGTETGKLELNGEQMVFQNVFGPDLIFSPDGSKIAWVEGATQESGPPYNNYLHIANISDINNSQTVQTLTSLLILKWLPDNSKIMVFDLGSLNDPIEKFTEFYKENPDYLKGSVNDLYGIYEVTISPEITVRNYNLPTETMGSLKANAYMDLYDVSLDSRQIILSTYEKNDKGGYNTLLKLFNLDTFTFSDMSGFSFANTAVDGIHWIP